MSPDEYYPNSHGMASSLTTYTFFYSQYHQMLLSVINYIDSNCLVNCSKEIDKIFNKLGKIRDDFSYKYNRCIRRHSHPKIYYERGMLKMHDGDFEGAMTDVNRFMQLAKKQEDNLNLTSDMYQQEGQIYNELGMYDQAVEALTKAITLDSNNKGAYFNRAQAYFETGEFDLSLQDYISSEIHESSYSTKLKPSENIKESILNGLLEGSKEAAIEFFPSLCQTTYGLGSALWTASLEYPYILPKYMANACLDISQNLNEFFKNVDITDPDLYVEEFQKIRGNFDRLSDSEKTNFVAYLVGKYGVDIFAGGATLKGVALIKKLKNANRIANLEALAAKETKEAIKVAAVTHAAKREAFFKNAKIHYSKDGAHIVPTFPKSL
jgi:tetratricopeptide (TPR) repeat protein